MNYSVFEVLFAVGLGVFTGVMLCRLFFDIIERRKRKSEEKN